MEGIKDRMASREKECLDFLKAVPENSKYVLIGGYAVTAYGFPRFSVDLDIVLPKGEQPLFENMLKERDFKYVKERKEVDDVYSGEFRKYEKKMTLPVSVDLLINAVKSRQTDTSYPFEYLLKNSETRTVVGWNPESKTNTRVADREMLIALKINSMRLTDQRDIIILCYEKPDVDKITKHLERCPREVIQKHLELLLGAINDPQQVNSLRGAFSLNEKTHQRIIKNAKNTIEEITTIACDEQAH